MARDSKTLDLDLDPLPWIPLKMRHSSPLMVVMTFLLVCLGSPLAQAQQAVTGEKSTIRLGAVVNFNELALHEAAVPVKPERKLIPFLHGPGARPLPAGVAIPLTVQPPQTGSGPSGGALLAAPSPAAVSSFAAAGDNDTSIPPDTMGAVGPNNLMVALNTQVSIQSKAGSTSSTVSLDSFWNSLSGVSGVFDPRLAYDPYNNRWIFVAGSNGESNSSKLLVGVSQTGNPSELWNLYETTVDGTGTDWGDYPSLGFTKDWVVVDLNLFKVVNNNFTGGRFMPLARQTFTPVW